MYPTEEAETKRIEQQIKYAREDFNRKQDTAIMLGVLAVLQRIEQVLKELKNGTT